MTAQRHESTEELLRQNRYEELLHRNHYSPEELADLLETSVHFIRHEVYEGRLKAFVCDHRILDIRREDALAWLRRYGLPERQRR